MSTLKVNVFEENVDTGWLGDNQRWWFDPNFPHSFSIFDLDGFYEEQYYEQDHVSPQVVDRYTHHVLDYGRRILGREVRSLLELGCAGGWFTKKFLELGIDIIAVEGTHAGYNLTRKRGVPDNVVFRHDLRKPLTLNRTFDMVVCTEVAEHIECPFSSQLVQNIVNHGKIAWFSFEEPGSNDAHYHHCNEQPERFWTNIFKFYGYDFIRLPEEISRAVEGRGELVFSSQDIAMPEDLADAAQRERQQAASLGSALKQEELSAADRSKALIKQLVPPIIWNSVRRFGRRD